MKKALFLSFFLLLWNVANAQVELPITFELDPAEYELTDFGGNASEIVEDPTDSSNSVVQTTKTAGSETWAGTTVAEETGFSSPLPFEPGSTTMSVRVWSPTADIPVRLKVEDVNDGNISVETEAMTTVAEEWETLVFDFSNEASGTAEIDFDASYTKASIFLDFDTEGDDATYYWDDMEMGGESTGPSAPPVPVGFVANESDDSGVVFLAAGPNDVGGDIVYRLFYALSSDDVDDPLTASEYEFGNTPGDGDGVNAFGFNLEGLDPGAEYTFWLYQYNSSADLYSDEPATASQTAGGDDNGTDPDPEDPSEAAPTPSEDADNVISVFSEAYTSLAGTNFNPNWGQSTQVEIVEIEGNETLKYSNFNYQGTEFADPIDASGMTTMHLDMWTADATSVNFFLISTGPEEKPYELPITTGEWVSYEIPVSHFDNVDLADIIQFKFDGGDSTPTIYLDNLYFSSEGDDTDPVSENLIINGDFSDGIDSWEPFILDGVSADIDVVEGEASITNISGAGGEVWHLQFNQILTSDQIGALETGETYTASFDARSSADDRQLRLYFGEDGGGFVPVNITDFSLSTTMETYDVTFTVEQTFENMKFGFEMGLSNEDVIIDNVELFKGGEDSGATAPEAPAGFVVTDMIGDNPVGAGEIFLAVGPNQVVDNANIEYRLFYSTTADAPENPRDATEYSFGSTAGDGDGVNPFGFVLSGLEEATEYTAWLYQYDAENDLFSEPAVGSAVSGGESGDPDPEDVTVSLPITFEEDDIDWENAFVDFDGGIATVIDNPDQSEINPSERVAQMVKGAGQPWGGSYLNLTEPLETDEGPISMMVWAPRENTTVLFKIENSDDPDLFYEVEQTIPVSGEWTEMSFDMSGADSGVDYDRLVLIFDLGTEGDGSADFTWFFDNIEFETATSIVDDFSEIPAELSLNQNYPNPFNPATQITFALPESGDVRLDVFNITGQRVATLANQPMSAGSHSITFDASGLSSGVYFYRLQSGSSILTKKMTLLK